MLASGETRRDYQSRMQGAQNQINPPQIRLEINQHVRYGFWQDVIYLKPKVEE